MTDEWELEFCDFGEGPIVALGGTAEYVLAGERLSAPNRVFVYHDGMNCPLLGEDLEQVPEIGGVLVVWSPLVSEVVEMPEGADIVEGVAVNETLDNSDELEPDDTEMADILDQANNDGLLDNTDTGIEPEPEPEPERTLRLGDHPYHPYDPSMSR